jgi:hypothetical protein
MRAVHGILATKALEDIPRGIVYEPLRIGRIDFRNRQRGYAGTHGGVRIGGLDGFNGVHVNSFVAVGSMLSFRQLDQEAVEGVRQRDLAG